MMKRLVRSMLAVLLATVIGSASTGAEAGEILLGPGDVLRILVYGNPDLTLETRVSEAGAITFPLIGEVAVGNMSSSLAEKKIATLLETGGFVRKAQVNIIVTLLQSQQVSVLGQVTRPGRYPIDGKRSLMDFLALAGGITIDGGDTVSLIRRRNGVTRKDVIDVIQMVRTGEFSQDVDLSANDVIYVERAPRFYIYGEVQHPGPFRLERAMTVLQALSAGGGLTPRGTQRGIRIRRRDANGVMQVIEAKHDDLVQVDDVVYVQESFF
jgi:polysaccharide export outer membrane protein